MSCDRFTRLHVVLGFVGKRRLGWLWWSAATPQVASLPGARCARPRCGSRKPRPHGRATTYGGDLPPLLQVESVPFESPERVATNPHGTVESARSDTTSILRESVSARARKPGAPPPAHGPRANGEAAKVAKERPHLLDFSCETLAELEIGAHHRSA